MERLRNVLKQRPSSPAYEPLDDDPDINESRQRAPKQRFSWLEYNILLLLGISMLWAWYIFNLLFHDFPLANSYVQEHVSCGPPILPAPFPLFAVPPL